MQLRRIKEGKVEFYIPKKNTYEAEVFYNSEAEVNRDISVLVARKFRSKKILDALSATGIRGLRYAKEAFPEEVVLNDKNPLAFSLIKKNIKFNKLGEKCRAENKDANIIMHEERFDFIDIDPFGSPVYFLDSAFSSIKRNGIVSLTATDTTALCGVFPKACERKYGVRSVKTDYYAELGARILVTAAIRYAAKYDKAFIPILSFSDKHYFKIFGKIEYGAKKSDKLLDKFGYVMHCPNCGNRKYGEYEKICECGNNFSVTGPIFLGRINDKKVVKGLIEDAGNFKFKRKEKKLLISILDEVDVPFYYDIHYIGKLYKKKLIKKIENIISDLRSTGFLASRSSFSATGVKTNASLKELLKFI